MSNPQVSFRSLGNQATRYVLNVFLICLTLSFITACDFAQKSAPQKTTIKPPFANEKAINKETAKDIAKPVSTQSRIEVSKTSPNETKQENAQKIVNTGYKTEILFPISNLNVNERLTRLENAVQNISDKLIKLDPTITRLAEIDDDLSLLTNQLEILVSQDSPSSNPAPVMPQRIKKETTQILSPQKVAKTVTPKKPKAQSLKNAPKPISIQKIRMGGSPDKVRIVFDSNHKLTATPSLIQKNMLQVQLASDIDLSNITVNKNVALVKDIKVNNKTKTMLFTLNRDIRKMESEHLKPNTKTPQHRYYIDLK